METELRKMALDKAITIVDKGLVRHGDEWITPKEKELRIRQAEKEMKIEKLKAQKAADRVMRRKLAVQQGPTPNTGAIDYSSVIIGEGFGFFDIVVGDPKCTRDFIKSRLGESDVETERDLDYGRKYGLRFRMATDADLLIEIILNKRFKGKLTSNISMTSSMEDIFEAYGYPVDEEFVDDLFRDYRNYANRTLYRNETSAKLWYRDLGLMFWFEEDLVVEEDLIEEIVVFRK